MYALKTVQITKIVQDILSVFSVLNVYSNIFHK